jgi:hypothetical protein
MATAVMTPSSVASDITTIAASLNEIAAPWYNAVSFGTPVSPVPTNAAQAALQQAAIQQQQQQALLSVPGIGPLLAGLLANPTLLLVIIVAVIGGIVLIVKR